MLVVWNTSYWKTFQRTNSTSFKECKHEGIKLLIFFCTWCILLRFFFSNTNLVLPKRGPEFIGVFLKFSKLFIHQTVCIYVYLQFKSEFIKIYLALTSLKLPLIMLNKNLLSRHNQANQNTIQSVLRFRTLYSQYTKDKVFNQVIFAKNVYHTFKKRWRKRPQFPSNLRSSWVFVTITLGSYTCKGSEE